ncbi:MAG TPA: hypothetical protein VHA74_00060 [Candidatus Dojkabacteria bacterium]|nr:hypothetical protein [Candidatus Dojkabacteria bacterium]
MEIKNNKLSLLNLFLISIGVITLTSIAFLVLNTFYPWLVVLVSFFIILLFISLFKPRLDWKVNLKKDIDWILVVILFFGLIMRIQPWLYLEGGQDQGVYISLSHQYEKTHGLYITDDFRQSLTQEQKYFYDKDGMDKVLGIRHLDLGQSKYYFYFYPAHPVWMSMFGSLIGSDNRVYSLTFFSLLSIVAIYLLTKLVTKNRYIGLTVAILMTLNPLHLFFSKFPAGEEVALAFFLFAFYLFIKFYYDSKERKSCVYDLLASLLLIISFFFTRITGILYLPIIIFLLTVFLLKTEDRQDRIHLICYASMVYISYILSNLVYLIYIPFLFAHSYKFLFAHGKLIPLRVLATSLGLISVPILYIYLITGFKEGLVKVWDIFNKYYKYFYIIIGLILVLFSVYYLYKVGFTDFYKGKVYDTQWFMVGTRWFVLKDLSITSIFMYLTPLFVVPVFYFLFKKDLPSEIKILLFVFLYFCTFTVVITKFIPHHYYFARYQLSEIIPLGLILLGYVLYELIKDTRVILRTLGWLTLTLIIVYFGYFSFYLYQGPVGADESFFTTLEKTVGDKNSAVIYYQTDAKWPSDFMVTPLRYYFDFNVFQIKDIKDFESNDLTKLPKSYTNLYYLSTTKLDKPYLKYVATEIYTQTFYAATSVPMDFPLNYTISNVQLPFCNQIAPEKHCGGIIPIKYHKGTKELYLYKIDVNSINTKGK